MLIVQPLRARHRLARDGNRARGAKRPEEVQGRERGDRASRRYRRGTHAREEFDKRVRERLHDAVGFREERAVWFLGKLGWITIPAW